MLAALPAHLAPIADRATLGCDPALLALALAASRLHSSAAPPPPRCRPRRLRAGAADAAAWRRVAAAPMPRGRGASALGAATPPPPEAGAAPSRSIRCAPKSGSTSTTARARIDLWERLRPGFAMPDLDSDAGAQARAVLRTRPDYVQRMTERGGRYLFHIVEEVEKRSMPTELALLPFVESAFNPQAMSMARASGMWQFMPATGRDFELKQNVFRDDRRDVLASTRAALDYLERLHGMFGDWHLALAAYNWGEGNVQRAMHATATPACRPTTQSLRDAGRNARLRAQAAGGEEHRRAARGLRPHAAASWRTTRTS